MEKYTLLLKDYEGKDKGSPVEVSSKELGNIGIGQTINYSIFDRNESYKVLDIQRDVQGYEDNLKMKGIEKRLVIIAQQTK